MSNSNPPNPESLAHLRVWLRYGRYDYDWVASRIYAACYNDADVMRKVLAANPEDVPSSGEGSESSDGEYDPDDEESEGDGASRPDTGKSGGSRDNPVVLEGDETEDGDGAKGNGPGLSKRKRATSDVNTEESTVKKSKQPDKVKPLLCLNCGKKFNTLKNKNGKCRYHPAETVLGDLEDNPTNDDISDDEDLRATWPNAFNWDCCEATLEDDEEAACETGEHRAGPGEQTEYSKRRAGERQGRRYYG